MSEKNDYYKEIISKICEAAMELPEQEQQEFIDNEASVYGDKVRNEAKKSGKYTSLEGDYIRNGVKTQVQERCYKVFGIHSNWF